MIGWFKAQWNRIVWGWRAPPTRLFGGEVLDEAIADDKDGKWLAPPVFHDNGVPDNDEWPPDPESPKYIILYRGELTPEIEYEVTNVLRELRLGNISHFQANAALYDVAVELGLPVLFWATTYEKYSGPLLGWND